MIREERKGKRRTILARVKPSFIDSAHVRFLWILYFRSVYISPSPLVALIEINQKRDLDEFYSPSPFSILQYFVYFSLSLDGDLYIYIYIIFLNKRLFSAHDTRGVQSKFMQSGIAKNGASRDESQRKGSKTCRFWNLRHSMRMTFFSSV